MLHTFLCVSTLLKLLAMLTAATIVFAGPTSPEPHTLIVYSPPIITPKEGTVWKTGGRYNVTWDTSGIPDEKRGTPGLVLLGHSYPPNNHTLHNGTTGGENLDIAHPLASGFLIESGSVTVTILKSTVPRHDYFIVLFGDSGNRSPKFKIRKA